MYIRRQWTEIYILKHKDTQKTLETGGSLVSRTFPLEESEFKCLAQGHNCDHYQLKDCPMWGFNLYGPHKINKFCGFQTMSTSFDPIYSSVLLLKVDHNHSSITNKMLSKMKMSPPTKL